MADNQPSADSSPSHEEQAPSLEHDMAVRSAPPTFRTTPPTVPGRALADNAKPGWPVVVGLIGVISSGFVLFSCTISILMWLFPDVFLSPMLRDYPAYGKISLSDWPEELSRQNELRAKYNLPPIPAIQGITQDHPAVSQQ